MKETEKAFIPCFLCGKEVDIRYSKREKPYLVCDPCGVQIFVRGKSGISRLSSLSDSLMEKSGNSSTDTALETLTLSGRLAELRVSLEKIEASEPLIRWGDSPEKIAILREIERIEKQLAGKRDSD